MMGNKGYLRFVVTISLIVFRHTDKSGNGLYQQKRGVGPFGPLTDCFAQSDSGPVPHLLFRGSPAVRQKETTGTGKCRHHDLAKQPVGRSTGISSGSR